MEQTSLQRARRIAEQQAALKIEGISSDVLEEEEYDDVWPTRMPSSVRRYQSDVKMERGHAPVDVQPGSQRVYSGRNNAVPARRTAAPGRVAQAQDGTRRQPVETEEIITGKALVRLEGSAGQRRHWLGYVGLCLLIMTVGWVALSMVTSWWQVTQEDWRYGRPRTYQTDQVVGHSDSATNPSHFIALNLNRHVQVIEFQGGDAAKVKLYDLPMLTGQGQELAPVTLLFKDLKGSGKVDMIVCIQDSRFIFINEDGQFRPLHTGEHVAL